MTPAARPSAAGGSGLRAAAAVPDAGAPPSRIAGMAPPGTAVRVSSETARMPSAAAGVRPLLDGLWLECGAGHIVLRSETPLETVSSAVLGGGVGPAHTVLALRVPPDYASTTPAVDLAAAAAALGLLPPVVGLLTAAPLDRPGVSVRAARGLSAAAVVTAGLGNACTAGSGAPAAWRPGTINAVVVLDARLEPAALVNLVVTVTEAKAALLARRGVRGPTGEPATGTTTDAVVVAATGRGPLLPFGGPGTLAGWLAARTVRAALAVALDRVGEARGRTRARPSEPRRVDPTAR